MTRRYLTEGHAYFTVEATACTIQKRGAQAIVCGDAPRRDDEEKTTSYSMRAPLLLMPPDIFEDAEDTLRKVADVLNENAARFFSSAQTPKSAIGAVAETLIRIKDRLTDRAERDAINEAVAALYAREVASN